MYDTLSNFLTDLVLYHLIIVHYGDFKSLFLYIMWIIYSAG